MDSPQSFLSLLVVPALPVSAALSPLLGAVGLVVLLGFTWPRRAVSKRARGFMFAGVALAGGGLLATATAPMWAGAMAGVSFDWSQLTPAAGVVALLCVGAGAERLSRAPYRDRRGARTLEAGALVLVVLGACAALLAAPSGIGAIWTSATQLPAASLVPIGWCVALAGAAGVVAANASGRHEALAARARRGALAWGAFLFATALAAGALAQGTAVGGFTAQDVAFALMLASAAALTYLAWTVRRVLARPTVGAAHRPRVAQRRAPHPARLAPSLPLAGPSGAMGITPTSLLSSAAAAAGQPFAPPALRRSLVAASAAALPPAVVFADEPTLPTALERADPPTLPALGPAPERADQPTAAAGGGLVAQPPLSPQFVTAILELQTEMLRAGREYSFEELVNVFGAISPRGPEARLLWTNLASSSPTLGATTGTALDAALGAGDDAWPERPPTTMPRIRPTIVP